MALLGLYSFGWIIVGALYPGTTRTLRSTRDNGDADDCSSD
ncbi:hypothetical protein Pcac1_g11454 [Phytophthora cactorum]|nr:hypothetical protein Pcac1_g11454 [Phytophthora cactorum]